MSPDHDDRALSVSERDMVAQTLPPGLDGASEEDLRALGKRLRQARDRARRIANRQRREMRGKSAPHGASPARDNIHMLTWHATTE